MYGILLQTKEYPNHVVLTVLDYSKVEIVKTIENHLSCSSSNIEQLSACTTYGIYGIKKTATQTELNFACNYLERVSGMQTEEMPIVFEVKYVRIIV